MSSSIKLPTRRSRAGRPKRPTYNQPKGAFWLARIQRALADRTHVEADWEENEKLANARTVDLPGMAPGESIYVNHIKTKVDQMVADMAFNTPRFATRPRRPKDERNYQFAAAWSNLAADIVKLDERLQEATEDACHCTFAYLKLGWKLEDVDVRHDFGDEGEDNFDDRTREVAMSILKPEQDTVMIGAGPFTYVIDPHNAVRSRGSKKLQEAAWFAERITMRYEDLAAIRGIKNLGLVRANAEAKVSEYAHTYGGRSTIDRGNKYGTTPERAIADPDDALVELWEVWDLRYMTVTLIAEGVQDELRETVWPYDIGRRYPVVEVCLSRVRSQPYPLSLVSAFKELSIAKNKLETYKYRHVKVATPRWGYDVNKMDPEDAEQFLDGEPLSFFPVDGDPEAAAKVIAGPAMNQDVKYEDASLQNAMDVVSVDPDYGRSGQAPTGQTATVANIQTMTKSAVVKFRRKKIEKAALEWAELITMIARQCMDGETYVRVAGVDALTEKLVPMTAANLDGMWDFEMLIDSMTDKDVNAEAQKEVDRLNILTPLMAPGTNLNGKALLRPLLKKWNVPNVDEVLGEQPDVPPADPAEENALMLIGTIPPVSKRENFNEHRAKHVQAVQYLQQQPEPNLAAIDRIVRHLTDTDDTEKKAMIEAQVKAQMDQQIAQQLAAGQGGFKRGPGAGGPAATGPARPRQLAERQTSTPHILGAQQRGAPK